MAEAAKAEIVQREQPEAPPMEIEPMSGAGTLFGTSNPRQIVQKATDQANVLIDVVKQKNLSKNIKGKQHLQVEAWTFLGTMVGVFARTVWTRKLEGSPDGWEARVEAVTLDGQVVGAAEAMCTRDEKRWGDAEDYAVRAMSQTRATSRALRQPLGFIAVLAGFEATAESEMPEGGGWPTGNPYGDEPPPQPMRRDEVPPKMATTAQTAKLHILSQEHGWDDVQRHARAGVDSFKDLTRKQAGEFIEKWEQMLPDDIRAAREALGNEHDHEHVWVDHPKLQTKLQCSVEGCAKLKAKE